MKLTPGDQIAASIVCSVRNGEVICKCICENYFKATEYEIMFGKVRSCGCLSPECEEYIIKLYRYFNRYKRSAIAKGYEFQLHINDFVKIINSRCYYCGKLPYHAVNVYGKKFLCNGIDRIDSKKGYTISNVVTACTYCNYSKCDSSYNDYINQINKIYNNIFLVTNRDRTHNWVDPKYYKVLHSIVRGSANGDSIPFKLGIADTINLISQSCFYCGGGNDTQYTVNSNKGIKLNLNGIDRIDSSRGYTKENTLTCCKNCNFMKRDYSFIFFLSQVKSTYFWRPYDIV